MLAIDMEPAFARLFQTLRTLRNRPEDAPLHQARVLSGLEACRPGQNYHWHGRRREGDERAPFLVWQYTLAGQGAFRAADCAEARPLGPGEAFTSIVPSDDAYFLPPESPGWTFFWLIIDHPYVVRRVQARLRNAGAVWAVPPASPLVGRAVDLYDALRAAGWADEFAEEAEIFGFLLEWERWAHALAYPAARRERLLAEVRAEVLAAMAAGRTAVPDLAGRRGMSRTRFSHHFRRTTGLSPARFVTQVRIGEAARLLASTDLKLAAVASQTGFADATHLGKVFRRLYFVTPDTYRRSMR